MTKQPQRIELSEIPATMKTFRDVHQTDILLGSMVTTQGILLIFFSHRFNREVPLIVAGTEVAKVLQEVERYI